MQAIYDEESSVGFSDYNDLIGSNQALGCQLEQSESISLTEN